jgi:hypothetical protein
MWARKQHRASSTPTLLGGTPGPGGSGPGDWVVRTRLLQGKGYASTMAEIGRLGARAVRARAALAELVFTFVVLI